MHVFTDPDAQAISIMLDEVLDSCDVHKSAPALIRELSFVLWTFSLDESSLSVANPDKRFRPRSSEALYLGSVIQQSIKQLSVVEPNFRMEAYTLRTVLRTGTTRPHRPLNLPNSTRLPATAELA